MPVQQVLIAPSAAIGVRPEVSLGMPSGAFFIDLHGQAYLHPAHRRASLFSSEGYFPRSGSRR
jgi:hypothetical protein